MADDIIVTPGVLGYMKFSDGYMWPIVVVTSQDPNWSDASYIEISAACQNAILPITRYLPINKNKITGDADYTTVGSKMRVHVTFPLSYGTGTSPRIYLQYDAGTSWHDMTGLWYEGTAESKSMFLIWDIYAGQWTTYSKGAADTWTMQNQDWIPMPTSWMGGYSSYQTELQYNEFVINPETGEYEGEDADNSSGSEDDENESGSGGSTGGSDTQGGGEGTGGHVANYESGLTSEDVTETDTEAETGVTATGYGFWNVYKVNVAQLATLGGFLWSTSFIDNIIKTYNDPMNCIVSLHALGCVPSGGTTENIKIGNTTSTASGTRLDSYITSVSCGSITLTESWGNMLDYAPYTKVQLVLPYCGIYELNTDDVMMSTLSLTYHVDVCSGACTADLTCTRTVDGVSLNSILYQFTGNMASARPLSQAQSGLTIGSILQAAGGVVTVGLGAVASGGLGALAATAGGLSLASSVDNMVKQSVSRSGNFSGNAGLLGVKTPYLIITKPNQSLPADYKTLYGYPANLYKTVGQCSGFTQVSKVHVNIATATDTEKQQIEDALIKGVIV